MKTTATPLTKIAGIIVLGSALLLSACSKTQDRATTTTTTTTSTTATTMADASETWDSIKTYSYDQKSEFVAKANEVAARLEKDTATAKGATSTHLAEARDELRTATAEISEATSANWEAAKERVGKALEKAETAYANVAE
ncbi:MAG TPA: hypothetical protein VL069_06920 [Opitutus sp.]|nr:hypothetical protein [Opitutus sp.]